MEFVRHASERLALAMVRAVWYTSDPRTFAAWGKAVAHTTWQLRAWCDVAQVPGRDALAFVRALRAVAQVELRGSGYEEVLDIAEPRTLERFLRRAGIPGRRRSGRLTPFQFLSAQTFVTKPELVQRVRELLANETSRRRTG